MRIVYNSHEQALFKALIVWTIYMKYQALVNIINPDMQLFENKLVIIFLPIRLIMCFACSKEPSQ